MTGTTLTYEELRSLGTCNLERYRELFKGRETLNVAEALDAGATVEEILWVAMKLGYRRECLSFALKCRDRVEDCLKAYDVNDWISSILEKIDKCIASMLTLYEEEPAKGEWNQHSGYYSSMAAAVSAKAAGVADSIGDIQLQDEHQKQVADLVDLFSCQ